MAVVAGFSALLLVMGAGVSAGAAGRTVTLQADPNAPAAIYADGQYPQDREGALRFSDVFPGMQFEREIGWLAATGVSTGWPDGTFLGASAVSRAAMAAFMYRLAGKPEFTPPAQSPFTDVAPGDQFYLPITWLAGQGITTGWKEADGTRTFRPAEPIHRNAMAAFMHRYAGSPALSADAGANFPDVPEGAPFAREINWLAFTGVTTGWPDGTFRGFDPVSRAAMAAFMYRFLHRAQPVSSDAIVSLGPLAAGHASALVRLSVRESAADVMVSVAGAPALAVGSGRSASTTVLAPVSGAGVQISATAETQLSVQLLATFDGDPAVPGATLALAAPVTRADTSRGLAGGTLAQEPVSVGVTGLGGVPAENVRSVYVTATVGLAAPDVLKLGGQELPLGAGTTSITTLLSPSEAGTVEAALESGSGSLRLDVRGYVPDAPQGASNINTTGSLVPVAGGTAQSFSAGSGSTAVPVQGNPDAGAALVLVAAGPAGSTGVLDLAPAGTAGVGGALVDAGLGAQPQFAFVPLHRGQPEATLSNGAAAATVLPLANLAAATSPAAGQAPSVTITSPAPSAVIDLGEGAPITLEGTVSNPGAALAAMAVSVAGNRVGSPSVRQTPDGLRWRYETAVPLSGQLTFEVTAVDRSGGSGSASVLVNAVLPAATEQIVSPDVVDINTADHPLQSVTPDAVTFANRTDVAIGEIIVEPASSAAPDGLLRRVTAVDQLGGSTVAATEPVALADVFLQVDFQQTVPLDGSNGLAVEETGAGADSSPGLEVVDEGVSAAAVVSGTEVALGDYSDTVTASWSDGQAGQAGIAAEGLGAQSLPDQLFSQAVETVQFQSYIDLKGLFTCDSAAGCKFLGKATEETVQKAKDKVIASAGYSIGGQGRVGMTLTFTLKTSLQWNWGVPSVQVDEFSTIAGTEMSAKATASAYVKTATSGQVKHEMAKLNMAPITFVVLTIPVVIRPGGTVYLQGNFSAEASVSVDMGYKRVQDYGFRYSSRGGFRNVDSGPKTSFSNPVFAPDGSAEITGKIQAGFGPTLKVGLLIYGFAGPELTVGAQAGVSAAVVHTGDGPKADVELFLGGEVVVAVKLTVPIIDRKILEAVIVSGTYRWTLKKWSWAYSDAFPGAPLPSSPSDPAPGDSDPAPGTGTPVTVPGLVVRVGQYGMVGLAPGASEVASVEWVSAPVPNATLHLGEPTVPAYLNWWPTAAGKFPFTVRVTYLDATKQDVSGVLEAFAVPPASLSISNLASTTSTSTPDRSYPYSMVTFEVVRTRESDTTPSKTLTDREDPASDYFDYISGDSNGNNRLDTGERWAYRGPIEWRVANESVMVRTILVRANDTTGAGSWIDAEATVTMTR